jgi:hypothetical protein
MPGVPLQPPCPAADTQEAIATVGLLDLNHPGQHLPLSALRPRGAPLISGS